MTPPARAASPAEDVTVAYRFRDVLLSEWTKLRSVRSTLWTLAVTVIAGVGLGALVSDLNAAHYASAGLLDRLTFDPARVSLSGMLFAQLAIGVLGVLVMSGEYGTGTIRATLAAVPRRLVVLSAKAAVFSLIAFVAGEVLSLTAFLVGQAILAGRAPSTTLADPSALRAVIGCGCYLTALGLLSLGLATIVRHTAGAISTFVAVLFVLPVIADALPSSLSVHIDKFLPANIGIAMLSMHPPGLTLAPWTGFALLCAYAVGTLAVGALLLVRRDA